MRSSQSARYSEFGRDALMRSNKVVSINRTTPRPFYYWIDS